ncbi:MAG: hypothetical protein AAF466_01050 [Bacteroidota bacterium]
MRKYAVVLCLLALFSCQKEELTVTEGETETSFLADGQLTGLVKSVASHDGTFDDLVDLSSCFSINFPYRILLNGYEYEVNSIEDLKPITKYDFVVPLYPFSITYGNYQQGEVPTQEVFYNLVEQCNNGLLYDQRITCVDFYYPIQISVFNQETSDFETISFTHDRETFMEIELFDAGTLASINYPITLHLENDETIMITSDQQLKDEILLLLPICQ